MLLQQFHPFKKNLVIVWWRELSIITFFLMAIGIAGFPPHLKIVPKNSLFFELFIKDILLIVVIACILFFIQIVKPKSKRLHEYIFLNSLPLTETRLSIHFLVADIVRYSWLPGLVIILLFSLLKVAPLAHIFRVNIVIFIVYGTLLTMNSAINFFSTSKKFNPLSKLNPLPAFLMCFLFLVLLFAVVLLDSLLSSFSFLLILLLSLVIQWLSFLMYRLAFQKWHRGHRAYRVSGAEPSIKFVKSMQHRSQWNLSPILIKNILKIAREKSLFVVILTVVFVLCGYLVSRNNQRSEDFLAILNTSVLLYAIIFSYRSQYILSPDSESTQILFSLPIRRIELYITTVLPLILWMFLINTIFVLLALTAGVSVSHALIFWLKSSSMTTGFVFVSFNFVFITYPEKTAQKYFLYWGLVYIIFMAVFFEYWYPIFLGMVGLSFLKVINKKLFRFV